MEFTLKKKKKWLAKVEMWLLDKNWVKFNSSASDALTISIYYV